MFLKKNVEKIKIQFNVQQISFRNSYRLLDNVAKYGRATRSRKYAICMPDNTRKNALLLFPQPQ